MIFRSNSSHSPRKAIRAALFATLVALPWLASADDPWWVDDPPEGWSVQYRLTKTRSCEEARLYLLKENATENLSIDKYEANMSVDNEDEDLRSEFETSLKKDFPLNYRIVHRHSTRDKCILLSEHYDPYNSQSQPLKVISLFRNMIMPGAGHDDLGNDKRGSIHSFWFWSSLAFGSAAIATSGYYHNEAWERKSSAGVHRANVLATNFWYIGLALGASAGITWSWSQISFFFSPYHQYQ
jgi:hypothetical protein